MEYQKNICILEPRFFGFSQNFISQVTRLGINLNRASLQAYEHRVVHSIRRMPGIIGGHVYNIRLLGPYFVKIMAGKCLLNEVYLYHLIVREFPDLAKFLVKCFGVIFASDFDKLTVEAVSSSVQRRRSTDPNLLYFPFDK